MSYDAAVSNRFEVIDASVPALLTGSDGGRHELTVKQQKGLATLEKVARLLAAAQSLDEIKGVRDTAETARTYAKAAHLGIEIQNLAAELKLRAERKAGEFLRRLELRGGDRRSKSPQATLKLEDLGISKKQSAQWQLEAAIPEAEFDRYLQSARSTGREITSAALLRLSIRRGDAQPKARRSPGRAAPPGEPGSDLKAWEAARELVDELRHHHSGLSVLLMPLLDDAADLSASDQRLARYLLGELARVLEELASGIR